jgi:hypothetical protein
MTSPDPSVVPLPLLEAWTATRIVMDGVPAVPLTGPGAVDSWPFDMYLVVLTAANPGSERLDPEVNAARNVELATALRDLGHHVIGLTAGLDDWEEPSLGVVGLGHDVARGFAKRFEQLGWYVLDADEVSVLATENGEVLHAGPRRHA